MAWRDNLRPATFRGIPFKVDVSSLTAGRRLARHEYPQRDTPYLEDMGRKAREYKVDAFIVGADYMAGRDQLLKAIEEAGPGQLVHPYHGTQQVTVSGEAQLTESTREGGMAKFSIVFVEAGRQEEPQTVTDTEAVLNDQYTASETSFADDFAGQFSVKGKADFVVQDALDSTNKLLAMPAMALGNLSYLRANPLSALTAMLPENLSTSLGNPRSLALGILALVRGVKNVMSLFDFGLPPLGTSAATPSRQAQSGNRLALASLVQQAATARRIVDLGSSQPSTLDDARAARAEIVQRADAVLLATNTGQRAADAVVQLRTNAVLHFSRQTADLPRLVIVTPRAVLPAIVVAHDFYGDDWQSAGRDVDLIARNRVRHPGFVPAGQPLQLISG
jgi:prophage DNA circulation protein